jgi:hypothetical protein
MEMALKNSFVLLIFLFFLSHNSYSADLNNACIQSVKQDKTMEMLKALNIEYISLAEVGLSAMESGLNRADDGGADAAYKLSLTLSGVMTGIVYMEHIQWLYSSINFDKNGNSLMTTPSGTKRLHSKKEIKEYLELGMTFSFGNITLAEGQLDNYYPNLRNSVIRKKFINIKEILGNLKKIYAPCMG